MASSYDPYSFDPDSYGTYDDPDANAVAAAPPATGGAAAASVLDAFSAATAAVNTSVAQTSEPEYEPGDDYTTLSTPSDHHAATASNVVATAAPTSAAAAHQSTNGPTSSTATVVSILMAAANAVATQPPPTTSTPASSATKDTSLNGVAHHNDAKNDDTTTTTANAPSTTTEPTASATTEATTASENHSTTNHPTSGTFTFAATDRLSDFTSDASAVRVSSSSPDTSTSTSTSTSSSTSNGSGSGTSAPTVKITSHSASKRSRDDDDDDEDDDDDDDDYDEEFSSAEVAQEDEFYTFKPKLSPLDRVKQQDSPTKSSRLSLLLNKTQQMSQKKGGPSLADEELANHQSSAVLDDEIADEDVPDDLPEIDPLELIERQKAAERDRQRELEREAAIAAATKILTETDPADLPSINDTSSSLLTLTLMPPQEGGSTEPIEGLLKLTATKLKRDPAVASDWLRFFQAYDINTIGDLRRFVANRKDWHLFNLPRRIKLQLEQLLYQPQAEQADVPDILRDEGMLSSTRRLAYVADAVVEVLRQEDTLAQRSATLPVESGGLTMEELLSTARLIGMSVDTTIDDKISDEHRAMAEEEHCSFNSEELEWIGRTLDLCQKIHALAVARLYVCKPGSTKWRFTGLMGGLAIVTESNLQMASAHYLRLIDLEGWNPNHSVVFEQELYTGFEYHMETPYFHAFEMNNILAGFSFADEVEADMFYLAVMECISTSSDQIIEQLYEAREKSVIMVGQSHVNVEESEDIAMLKRRYAAGGIASGTEVKWKKQAPPPELAKLMGYSESDSSSENKAEAPSEPVSGTSWKKNAQVLVVGEKATPEEPPAQLKQSRSKLLRKSVRGSKLLSRNVEKEGTAEGTTVKKERRKTIYNLFGAK